MAKVESAIQAAGVTLNFLRHEQEPYHTTLAVVNGSTYPVKYAIESVNERFAPGGWLAAPLTVLKPCNAHSATPEGFFC